MNIIKWILGYHRVRKVGKTIFWEGCGFFLLSIQKKERKEIKERKKGKEKEKKKKIVDMS